MRTVSTSTLLLLAACVPLIITGPVPRHEPRQLSTTYSNQSVHVDTAIIVQPIQKSVVASVIPAITFQNPDGQNIASENPQTVLFTTYFTPTLMPTPQVSSKAPSTSLLQPGYEAEPGKSRGLFPANTDLSTAPSNSLAAVEHTTPSQTSRQIPSFVYSPDKGSSVSSVVSTAIPMSKVSIEAPSDSPGFHHPSSNLPDSQVPSSIIGPVPTINSTIIQQTTSTTPLSFAFSLVIETTPAGNPSSLCPDTPSTSASKIGDSSSAVFVIETQYTTVYPSPSSIGDAPLSKGFSVQTGMPSEAQSTLSVEQSISPSISPSVMLSTSPPQPPAVVIVTQYTTVTPGSESVPTQKLETSGFPSFSQSALPIASASSLAPGPRSTNLVAQPAISSQAPVYLSIQPTVQPTVLPSTVTSTSIQIPQASSTTKLAPAPPGTSSVPLPTPVPSPTSESPLVVMPIPPSQIFTVTVTAAYTVKETTTVTVTA